MTDVHQAENAQTFAALHVKGDPLILCNIWDAGSAKAVAEAGAAALATGSWSVAAAQGYPDGESLPLDLLELIVKRIAAAVPLPLSVDFEGAYAQDPKGVAQNVQRIMKAGAIGVNFEDRIVSGQGLHPIALQKDRIAAMRAAAEDLDLPLFINARTDLFLQEQDKSRHSGLVEDACERAAAYAEAGASGFFVPGLIEPALIKRICGATALPVNIMAMPGAPGVQELAGLGVARVSHGPFPYRVLMAKLIEHAGEVLNAGG